MNQTEQIPDDPKHLPPARRRRARRLLAPLNADERADFLSRLAHRTSPSFDYFLFSFLAGLVISFALMVDSPTLLVLGALIAPFMAPLVGISLGTVIGSIRFFTRSLVGFLLGSLLVFGTGMLAGYLSQYWSPSPAFTQAHLQAQLSWANVLLLAVGAILTSAAIVHYDRSAEVSSVALAYAMYIPVAVAGFGLISGEPNLWPDGLVVYAVYLSWGALLGALTLAFLGFRPLTLFGYTLGAVVLLIGVILLIGLGGAGAVIGGNIAVPTHTPTVTATYTLTPTNTSTPVPPTATYTVTPTPVPPTATYTPTITLTPTPTPMFAIVYTPVGGGVFVRDAPAGEIIGLVANGTMIQVLPETEEQNGRIWVAVIAPDNLRGWMLQSLLVMTTPTPTP